MSDRVTKDPLLPLTSANKPSLLLVVGFSHLARWIGLGVTTGFFLRVVFMHGYQINGNPVRNISTKLANNYGTEQLWDCVVFDLVSVVLAHIADEKGILEWVWKQMGGEQAQSMKVKHMKCIYFTRVWKHKHEVGDYGKYEGGCDEGQHVEVTKESGDSYRIRFFNELKGVYTSGWVQDDRWRFTEAEDQTSVDDEAESEFGWALKAARCEMKNSFNKRINLAVYFTCITFLGLIICFPFCVGPRFQSAQYTNFDCGTTDMYNDCAQTFFMVPVIGLLFNSCVSCMKSLDAKNQIARGAYGDIAWAAGSNTASKHHLRVAVVCGACELVSAVGIFLFFKYNSDGKEAHALWSYFAETALVLFLIAGCVIRLIGEILEATDAIAEQLKNIRDEDLD